MSSHEANICQIPLFISIKLIYTTITSTAHHQEFLQIGDNLVNTFVKWLEAKSDQIRLHFLRGIIFAPIQLFLSNIKNDRIVIFSLIVVSNDQYQIQFWILNIRCSYSNGIEITNIFYIAMISKKMYFKELMHSIFIFCNPNIMCRQLKDRINQFVFDFLEDINIGVESALQKQYITI